MAPYIHALLGLGLAYRVLGAIAAQEPGVIARRNEPCENTATSRRCWGEYSIDTDWLEVTPETGITKEVNKLTP